MERVRTVDLRTVTAADLETLFAFQCDPEGCAMAGVHPRPREAFEAHWARALADPGVVARAIVADGAVAGSIGCFTRDGARWVGYWIGRAYWGRGIATRALGLLLGEVRERPLRAQVAAHNGASLTVLARCGFVEVERRWSEGTERYVACEEVELELR